MKQYTQEEIEFLQRWLNGEKIAGRVPSVEELEDIKKLIAQGTLKPRLIDFEYWYSEQSDLQLIRKEIM